MKDKYKIFGLIGIVCILFLAGCIQSNEASYNTGGMRVLTQDKVSDSILYILEDKYGNKYVYAEYHEFQYGDKSCAITQIRD